jgi:hypothetical protein
MHIHTVREEVEGVGYIAIKLKNNPDMCMTTVKRGAMCALGGYGWNYKHEGIWCTIHEDYFSYTSTVSHDTRTDKLDD